MKLSFSLAVLVGSAVGFLGCCALARLSEARNIFEGFVRLHPFLEQESAFFPTASQLAATARAQCPPDSPKTLVIIGGNSVFNGSGQKRSELWSRVLQGELGDGYHVINFSAPGAGVVDNGGVVFEMLSPDYPRILFVTNTEPGYYPPAYGSSYSYLFWDAYWKGLLRDDPARAARLPRSDTLDRRLNSALYFNDLWTGVAYQHVSTIWSSWLQGRSFRARRRLGDWYDKRPVIAPSEERFEELRPGHLAALRRRKCVAPERFRQEPNGRWVQTEESLRAEAEQIAALLPDPLQRRSLIVFTPLNPWFLERLTPDERSRVAVSFGNGVNLLERAGFHALSLLDGSFEPFEFGDTVHLHPAGGRRLAHRMAIAIRDLAQDEKIAPLE